MKLPKVEKSDFDTWWDTYSEKYSTLDRFKNRWMFRAFAKDAWNEQQKEIEKLKAELKEIHCKSCLHYKRTYVCEKCKGGSYYVYCDIELSEEKGETFKEIEEL